MKMNRNKVKKNYIKPQIKCFRMMDNPLHCQNLRSRMR